jgi:putative membrane protein
MSMGLLVTWLINALVIIVSAYILPGVHVENFLTALSVALVLGILNVVIKPILIFLTLPITIVTLGLFLLVINALMILLASSIVPGFTVDGFLWALVFSLVLSFINLFTSKV